MNNPGVYNLFSGEITAALSGAAQTPIIDLAGMQAVSLVARLAYGSGGATIRARVQTSLDGGDTWLDVASFNFTTASAVKSANVSGLTAKAVAAFTALTTDGVNDGLLATGCE